MKQDLTLLVLAAGIGSRFGGLKQIEPMGPNGEFLIDYSIYDAIKVGFTKVVFLIKEENYEIFQKTIGRRIESNIKVEYCFQKNNNIPIGYEIPNNRIKPLGTAHAILCCKDKIHEPFMIINADDFYGKDAFFKGMKLLKNVSNNNYGIVLYKVINAIPKKNSVKRGICEVKDNELTKIVESSIEQVKNEIIATPLNENKIFKLKSDTKISLNMIVFAPNIFNYIENKFSKFLNDNKNNLENCEFLIPDLLLDAINDQFVSVKVLDTDSTWYGITYKEDVCYVKKALKKLIDNNVYPNNLWSKQ